jgi:rsbT co-antagonist protein RsbR
MDLPPETPQDDLETRLRELRRLLIRRDSILDAVGETAHVLFSDKDDGDHVTTALGLIGLATGVSRVYIFENSRDAAGNLLMSQRYEWVSGNIEPQLDNPELQDLPYSAAGFSRWANVLSQGSAIYGLVANFPATEQDTLRAQDIVALAILPVFTGNQWWGFIGFDDCLTRRMWAPVEIKALESVASMIGAAMHQRNIAAERLRYQEEIIASQSAMLSAMATPLLPIIDGALVLPLVGAVDDRRAQQILEQLLEGVARYQAEIVIIDITGVNLVDTQVADVLLRTTRAVSLLGARVVLTGIQPQIAITLVRLGVDMQNLVTCANLKEGVAYVLEQLG